MPRPEKHTSSRPIVGVSCVVEHEGSVLLVKRGGSPYAGCWSFPGGRVELGEHLTAAVAREVREETGLVVAVGALIDTAEIIGEGKPPSYHYVLLVFRARYVSGDVAAGDDAEEACWVALGDVPDLAMTTDTRRILSRLFPDP